MSTDSSIFSHITLGTNDEKRATDFYDAVLSILGFNQVPKPSGKAPMYARGNQMPYIYLYKPYDGRPATWGNGMHIAFLAQSRDQVDAFYRAALEHGGMDEGSPGVREHYADNYYAAYVRDPDGNKLQVVCYQSN